MATVVSQTQTQTHTPSHYQIQPQTIPSSPSINISFTGLTSAAVSLKNFLFIKTSTWPLPSWV